MAANAIGPPNNTAANRTVGGWLVFMAPTVTVTGSTPSGTNVPSLGGSTVVWTGWITLPSTVDSVKFTGAGKTEEFQPAEMLVATDEDVVYIPGVKDMTWEMKETNLTMMNLARNSNLLESGTPSSLAQAVLQSDFLMTQICLQRMGPNGGWGQILHFPKCKIDSAFPVTALGKVGTLAVKFNVFGTENPYYPTGSGGALFLAQGASFAGFQYGPA